ncbi:unnamed protein product [Ectocarpus sp. CCAP 1310/34]|nr:unnamed protein product [Ectocarpus sp. CCAP 1310/34]
MRTRPPKIDALCRLSSISWRSWILFSDITVQRHNICRVTRTSLGQWKITSKSPKNSTGMCLPSPSMSSRSSGSGGRLLYTFSPAGTTWTTAPVSPRKTVEPGGCGKRSGVSCTGGDEVPEQTRCIAKRPPPKVPSPSPSVSGPAPAASPPPLPPPFSPSMPAPPWKMSTKSK